MAFVACFDDACSKIKYVGLYWFVNASVMTSRMKQIFHRVCRLGSRYSCISTSLLYALVLQSSQCSEVDQRIYFLQTWIIFENLYRCARDREGFHQQQRAKKSYDILHYVVYQNGRLKCTAMSLKTQRDRLRKVDSRPETGANYRSSRGLVRIRTGNANLSRALRGGGLNCCFAVACKVLLLFLRST